MKLKTICVSIIIWILCIFAYGYGEFVTNDTCTADSIELKSYYDPEESKCYMREYLRDVSAYRSCTQFKRGQLLGPKSKTKLAKIVDELKADDSTNGEVPVSVNIETSEFLKLDQTVSIVVHLPEIEGPETSNQTLPSFEVQFKSYAGSYLFGVSLRIKIDMVYQDNQLVIANWIGGSNVQFDKFPNIEYDLPLNNWDFKFNVTLKEANKFEITIGHEQPFMYPKLNMGPVSGTHVIDRYIITAENGAQPKSLKIDDNELLLDPYFSDCMAVGLISDKENNWFWEDRKDLEESTVVNGPDIEAQKLYGCVDVNTLPYPEFFTFPAQLMKFVICQYFDREFKGEAIKQQVKHNDAIFRLVAEARDDVERGGEKGKRNAEACLKAAESKINKRQKFLVAGQEFGFQIAESSFGEGAQDFSGAELQQIMQQQSMMAKIQTFKGTGYGYGNKLRVQGHGEDRRGRGGSGSRSGQGRVPSNSGCFNCGEPGHFARDCPKERKERKEKTE